MKLILKFAITAIFVLGFTYAVSGCLDLLFAGQQQVSIPTTTFSCFVQAVTVTTQCQAAPAAGLRAY